jgi:hypothetical protein
VKQIRYIATLLNLIGVEGTGKTLPRQLYE